MKPRYFSPLLGSIALLVAPAHGAVIQKLNNVDPLNLASSWNGGVVPGPNDIALFDSAITAQFTVPIGGDLALQGIRLTNVQGARNADARNVRIDDNSSFTLSLGSAGIDLSSGLHALALRSRLLLTADQTWVVPNVTTAGSPAGFNNGEDLSFQAMAADIPMDFGGRTLTLTGTGAITITSGYTMRNGTVNVGSTFLVVQGGNSRVTTVEDTVNFNVLAGATLRFAAQSGAAGLTTVNHAPITLNEGSRLQLHLNQANTMNVTGDITVAGNATWETIGGSSGETTFSGNLLGSGNIAFSNLNTNASADGFLRMDGDNSGYTGTFTMNAATGTRKLRMTGNNAGSANATWVLGTDNILEVNGVSVQLGTLNGSGQIRGTSLGNPAGITVGSGAFSGLISDGSGGPMAVTKVGSGTLSLSAANPYTGPTTVSGGTLQITTAQTGGGTITVGDGATLGVSVSAVGSTLNTSGLTTGATTGATLQVDTGALGNPVVPVITATSFLPSAATLIKLLGTNLSPGTFPLIDYSGDLGPNGGFSNLSLSTPFRVGGSLANNAGNTSIDVTLTVESPRWQGTANGDWDIDPDNTGATGTPNWETLTSNTVTRYVEGMVGVDSVLFDDNATGTTTVNLTTTLSPVGAVVNNEAKTYTFTGPGKLSGGASLSKQGDGTLILANSVAYDHTGGTTVLGGLLQIGDAVTPGVGVIPTGGIANQAILLLERPDDFDIPSPISGTGTFAKNQTNTASLTSPFIYEGPIVLNQGTVRLTAGGNLSGPISGTGDLTLNGGIVQLSGNQPNTYTGLTTVSSGTLQLNKSPGVTAIEGDLFFTGTGGLTLSAADQISDTAVITYDKATNGGSIVISEAFGELNIINGADAGAQVQAHTGFVVNGLVTAGNTGMLAVASNHSATVGGINLSGGAIIRIAANSNFSTLTVNSLGITASGGTIQVGQGNNAFDATLNLNGDVTTTGNLNFTDGNFTGSNLRLINLNDIRTFNIGIGTTTTVAPDFGGPGGLTKLGEGTLRLNPTSVSSYTGPTTVGAGTLEVNGSLSGSDVGVTGGTLAGAGTITPGGLGVIMAGGGKLSPGVAGGVGTLTVNLIGGGQFEIWQAVDGPNTQALAFTLQTPLASDRVLVSNGSLNIGGGVLEFDDFAFTPGLSFDPNGTYTLFDGNAPITGILGLNLVGSISGQPFELQFADGGNDLVLASIPEPGSAMMLLLGVGAVAARRRRQQG